MSADQEREVIYEITRLGDIQRVAAVDVESGVEVIVQAPGGASLADVRALALRKLERALTEAAARPQRPGRLV